MKLVKFGIIVYLFCVSNFAFAQSFVLKFQDIAYVPKGAYSPKHCLAVWVNDANGTTEKYARTLCVLAKNYQKHLNKYESFNPTFNRTGTSTTDGTSGASATSYPSSPRVVVWNLIDAFGKTIADGKYKIYFEQTTSNGSGPYTSIEFIKNGTSIDLRPTTTTGFQNFQLLYTPPTTNSAKNIDDGNRFSFYPNPANDKLMIKLFATQKERSTIKLFSSSGNEISSKEFQLIAGENSITLSLNELNLSKGVYFIEVISPNFQLVDSFIKK